MNSMYEHCNYKTCCYCLRINGQNILQYDLKTYGYIIANVNLFRFYCWAMSQTIVCIV